MGCIPSKNHEFCWFQTDQHVSTKVSVIASKDSLLLYKRLRKQETREQNFSKFSQKSYISNNLGVSFRKCRKTRLLKQTSKMSKSELNDSVDNMLVSIKNRRRNAAKEVVFESTISIDKNNDNFGSIQGIEQSFCYKSKRSTI